MNKVEKEQTVNFDLSELNLHELIEVYNNISDFKQFLKESKIEEVNE